uniref:Uncharacterized protein n=1 Tax=Ixodes ricinus TaxID=34613 RepID=A0A6B0UN53_IXORI
MTSSICATFSLSSSTSHSPSVTSGCSPESRDVPSASGGGSGSVNASCIASSPSSRSTSSGAALTWTLALAAYVGTHSISTWPNPRHLWHQGAWHCLRLCPSWLQRRHSGGRPGIESNTG